MKTFKYKCGCVAELNREAWVSLCTIHEAEAQAIHQRWALEHQGIPNTKLTKQSLEQLPPDMS